MFIYKEINCFLKDKGSDYGIFHCLAKKKSSCALNKNLGKPQLKVNQIEDRQNQKRNHFFLLTKK